MLNRGDPTGSTASLNTKIRNTAKKTHFTDFIRRIAASHFAEPIVEGHALPVHLEFVGGLAVDVCMELLQ
jgi:hypothetical protein